MPIKTESVTSSKSLDVPTQQHATTAKKQPTMTERAPSQKTDMTATETASSIPMVTESATALKSPDVQIPLQQTMTPLLLMMMLRASSQSASILKHVTTRSSMETITASLCNPTRCTTEWSVTKTSQDMSPTESTSRRKTAMTSSQAFLVITSSQLGSCHREASCKVHSVDCSEQTKTHHSLHSSQLPNTIAM